MFTSSRGKSGTARWMFPIVFPFADRNIRNQVDHALLLRRLGLIKNIHMYELEHLKLEILKKQLNTVK